MITSTTTLGGTSVLTNHYDLVDQLTVRHAPLGNITYTYDGAGRQIGSVGITGLVTNTYNDLGQLTTVSGPGTNASYVSDGPCGATSREPAPGRSRTTPRIWPLD